MKDRDKNLIDENRQFDDLFRQGLENLRPEPSKDLWKGINRKLWWDEISHFTFTNLSKALWIGGFAGMIIIITALMVVVVPQAKSTDENSFSIINDPVSVNSGTFLYPESYSPDQTRTQLKNDTREEINENSNPSMNAGVTKSLPLQNSDKELLADRYISSVQPASYNDFNLSSGQVDRESDEGTFSFMETIKTPGMIYDKSDDINSYGNPEIITNIPRGIPPIPKFFSLDLGVTPEVSLYGNSSSQTEMNFTTNVGISYHFGRFSVKSGIGVSYVSDDGIYRTDYKSKDSVGFYNMVTSISINQQDPKEIIYFTQRIVVYDSLSHIADDRTRNRYTYLQIPLLAGFRLLESNRLGLTLHAGPMVSFLVGKKEAEPFIDYPNARIIRIDNNTPSRVKTNWQIWLGLRLDYKITKNFSLFAEPNYKYYFSPVAEQKEGYAKNPYSIGLAIGIEYNFGRKNH